MIPLILPKIPWKNRSVKYPYLEKYAVEQFKFFLKRHKPTGKGQIHKPKDLDALAMDIYWCGRCMLDTKEIVEFCDKLRKIINLDINNKGSVLSIHKGIENFLNGLRKIEDFYEFHQDRGGSIRDKRVTFLIDLRFTFKRMIRFMEKRTEKRK